MPLRLAPTGTLALLNGGTGATTNTGARTNLGLGGAAVLNIGTTTGTVAAGDDSRITGALASSTASTIYAPIASPTFTGTVTIPTGASIVGYALLANPTFTGIPIAPTATAGTNTTQIATTAFVMAAVGSGGSYNATSVAITGGSINNTTIGATTPSTGAFTTATVGSQLANYVSITGAPSTFGPGINVLGSDTNISLVLASKGSGTIYCTGALQIVSTANSNFSGTISSAGINSTPIGATAPSTGVFTTATAITAIAVGTNSTQIATTAFTNAKSIINSLIFG